MEEVESSGIGFFERYLSVWVILCMGIGIALGRFLPSIPTCNTKGWFLK